MNSVTIALRRRWMRKTSDGGVMAVRTGWLPQRWMPRVIAHAVGVSALVMMIMTVPTDTRAEQRWLSEDQSGLQSDGRVIEVPLPTPDSGPRVIAAGADGNM